MSSFFKGVTVGAIATVTCVYAIGSLADKEMKCILDADEQFHLDLGMNRVVENLKDKFKNMIK